jgi:hypothetical protein
VPAVRPGTWLIESARCFSPSVQALARVAGPKAFRHLLSERGLRGRTGDFVVPRRIAVVPESDAAGKPTSPDSPARPSHKQP